MGRIATAERAAGQSACLRCVRWLRAGLSLTIFKRSPLASLLAPACRHRHRHHHGWRRRRRKPAGRPGHASTQWRPQGWPAAWHAVVVGWHGQLPGGRRAHQRRRPDQAQRRRWPRQGQRSAHGLQQRAPQAPRRHVARQRPRRAGRTLQRRRHARQRRWRQQRRAWHEGRHARHVWRVAQPRQPQRRAARQVQGAAGGQPSHAVIQLGQVGQVWEESWAGAGAARHVGRAGRRQRGTLQQDRPAAQRRSNAMPCLAWGASIRTTANSYAGCERIRCAGMQLPTMRRHSRLHSHPPPQPPPTCSISAREKPGSAPGDRTSRAPGML